ncbi:probable aminopeptidase NPEPL1 [Uranotaenia lowii]|uniref:probable aminopeptidase NPEPL1 n=1 Tax=Uranotaenia lowii TaxID=190385 RepID=UPI0024799346|nr:probable aminopeptidase NPEPL1 [Uranotaenia lowii]XP_055592896.1 probable aminopeptidase NPEPL1 [Uranotaenia lowii]XP_055592897.1 probable aminopeptidase NPEPL1 [Uranotaenia lowii]
MSKLKFHRELQASDPLQKPVLIIGQLSHLTKVPFDCIRCKLEPRVNAETYQKAIGYLHPSASSDSCSLYLDLAKVAALPSKSSRHNSDSRAHAITKLVQAHTSGITESIVIVCTRDNLFASGCAVARAFPLYSRKTSKEGGGKDRNDKGATLVTVEFVLVGGDGKDTVTDEDCNVLDYAAEGIRLTAKIVDAPCNEMNVSGFLREVEAVAKLLKITPKIIRGNELREKGFGGIYGVGKAAADPPALAVLSYEPSGATETVAWVGKGIVFDTGGLSIKGKTAMPGMKRDCGGAAAILGAFYATVKSGYTQNLHAVFCLAENSVGPDATRPDDIHRLYSGRTVEINNTDAEGRLVLADGVCYADRDLKAQVILDMATLTGAQGIATGKYHGAILTNSEDWEAKSLVVGRQTADLLAPVPYCPELHFSEFNSAVADMKNSVMDRGNAQVSCAGLFIGAHLGFDYDGSWLHVDMASPVHCGERATGYGVALLMGLFGDYSRAGILKEIAVKGRNGAYSGGSPSSEPPTKKICIN